MSLCTLLFDQLGPGLRWWVWNPAAPSNTPMIGDAPLTSAVIFAAAAPFGTVLLTRLLLARGPYRLRSFAWRTAAVGILTPLAMMVFSAPTAPFGPMPATAVKTLGSWYSVSKWKRKMTSATAF